MTQSNIEQGLNDQIANEFYSAYLYLAMAAHLEETNFQGFANWMRIQHAEESAHAMRLFNHMLDTGRKVVLQALPQPPAEFGGPLEVMQQALAHERDVTSKIHQLYETAVAEKDYATEVQLQWFVSEQVEEERSLGDIIAQLKLAGDSSPALLMIDQQLAARKPGADGAA